MKLEEIKASLLGKYNDAKRDSESRLNKLQEAVESQVQEVYDTLSEQNNALKSDNKTLISDLATKLHRSE